MELGALVVLTASVVFVSVVPVALSASGGLAAFDCLTMLPSGGRMDQAETPCPIAFTIGDNFVDGVEYTVGHRSKVQLRISGSVSKIVAIFCRASPIFRNTPSGEWNSTDPHISPYTCLAPNDAMLSNVRPISEGTVLTVWWTPKKRYGYVEINCSVVSDDKKFRICNSCMITETDKTRNDPRQRSSP